MATKTATKAKTAAKATKAAKGTKAAAKMVTRAAAKPTKTAKPAAAVRGGAPKGAGTIASPWQLTTPPGTSAFIAWRDESATPPALVCKVGSTVLSYDLRCLADLHAMLTQYGDWVELGGTDEQKPAPLNSVESWGRSAANPIGGWYGLKNGLRGHFGVYVPPVMEALGLAEIEHQPRNNRMRAPRLG